MIPRRLTPPDGGPGTSDHVLTHAGLPRTYRVHVPPVLPLGSPLVIQLHGGGGNGAGLDRLTRFHALADRERFAVVSPSGVNRRWNDGRARPAPEATSTARPAPEATSTARLGTRGALHTDADDAGFIVALIDCVAGWLPVDRRRVYVAGISNGSMMAARLASEIPDRIAAYAQVAATVAVDAPSWWRPDRPVPFINIGGTVDPIVPYAGGAVRGGRRDRRDLGRVLAVDQWASLLVAHNHATGLETRGIPPDVSVRTWRGQTAQGDLEFWRVEGGGHTWPGGIQYLPARIIGTTSATFDATAEIWRFFQRRVLPEL